MNITLKKLDHHERLSEETYCFSAVVCIDGVPKFEATNDGHGGGDFHYPLPGPDGHKVMNEAIKQIEAYLATLPSEQYHGVELRKDVEWLVADLVTAALREKHKVKFGRSMKTRVYLFENNELSSLKPRKGVPVDAALCALAAKKYPKARILNLLPLDEAWSLAKASLGFPDKE